MKPVICSRKNGITGSDVSRMLHENHLHIEEKFDKYEGYSYCLYNKKGENLGTFATKNNPHPTYLEDLVLYQEKKRNKNQNKLLKYKNE